MSDTLITIGVLVFTLLVLPITVCVLWDRLTDRPPSPEQMRAAREAFEARLRNPQFEAVEARLGLPIPTEVRQLYADERLLAEPPFVARSPSGGEWEVAAFEPLDVQSLDGGFYVGEASLPFASNIYGDLYYVRLDQCRDGRCPVYLFYHDCANDDDPQPIAETLTEFLSYARRPAD